ncbi:MAG: aldehyde dehydrogenase family protein, partial [Rickettsiales bacterium]
MIIYSPANNKIIASIKIADIDDLKNIIINSSHAQQNYKNTKAISRSELLYIWYILIIENKEDLETIIIIERGKPISESSNDID